MKKGAISAINKPLPSAVDLEKAVVSAIVEIPSYFYNAKQVLSKECFYNDNCAIIWGICEDLHGRGMSADVVSLLQILKDLNLFEKMGGMSWYMDFMATLSHYPHDIMPYCAIIKDKFIRRTLIVENYKLINAAFDESLEIRTPIQKANTLISNVLNNTANNKASQKFKEVSLQMALEINDNLGMFQEIQGVPTGFESYDKRLGGFSNDGDLYIIAARPAMGKTTFAINCAYNAYKHFGYSGVFFSLEMSTKQICRKIVSKECQISTDDLKKNKLSKIQIEGVYEDLNKPCKGELIINDTANAEISYIISECHRLKESENIEFIFIDYLQLISCPKQATRDLEIGYISRKLKELSKNLKIPVIALCQLSRSVETRGGLKRPQLSDLREGGSLEQDASVVTFLWRPEYYGIEQDGDGVSLEGVCVAITAKNRHGDTGEDFLFFDGRNSDFCDYDHISQHKTPVERYNKDLLTMQNYNSYETNFREKMQQNNPDLPF
jgi:replicative DNA helicase